MVDLGQRKQQLETNRSNERSDGRFGGPERKGRALNMLDAMARQGLVGWNDGVAAVGEGGIAGVRGFGGQGVEEVARPHDPHTLPAGCIKEVPVA
jgi:hypothetical protein